MKPERTDVINQLGEILDTATDGRVKVEQVTPEMKIMDDLGLNSLDMLELAFEVEERWKLRLDESKMATLSTVGDVVTLICEEGEVDGTGTKAA